MLTAGPVPLLEVEVTETSVSFERRLPARSDRGLAGRPDGRRPPDAEFVQHEKGRFVSPGLWVDSWEVEGERRRYGHASASPTR